MTSSRKKAIPAVFLGFSYKWTKYLLTPISAQYLYNVIVGSKYNTPCFPARWEVKVGASVSVHNSSGTPALPQRSKLSLSPGVCP